MSTDGWTIYLVDHLLLVDPLFWNIFLQRSSDINDNVDATTIPNN